MKVPLRQHKKYLLLPLLFIGAGVGWNCQQSFKNKAALILYGNVDIRQVSLAFNVSERIVAMEVEEGDYVKKGDVLARLNTRPLELAIVQTRAQIAAQEATLTRLRNGSRPEEIRQARARSDIAAIEEKHARIYYQRMESLFQKDAISRQTRDDAETKYKVAVASLHDATATLQLCLTGPRQEDISAAEAQLAALKASLQTEEYNLGEAALRAPQDGVIRSRLMESGDLASPTKAVYLLGLENVKWVRAYIAEKRLGEIREGMKAQVVIDSFPDERLNGQVGYVSDTAEFTPKNVQTEELRSSLLYEIRVYVRDEKKRLRMGMPATIIFPENSRILHDLDTPTEEK